VASPFVKLSAELHQNPKVRKAGRNAREVFVFILCRNALMDGNGTLALREVEAWFLADQCQMTETEAQHGFNRAVTCDLLAIEGDRVSIVGWNDEWARRPLTDAERQSRRRENKKLDAVRHKESRSVRDESRSSHASVTSHAGEEKRREETRGEEREEPAAVAARKAKRHRKVTEGPLPQDWAPSSKAGLKAAELHLSLTGEVEKFRLHAEAKGRLQTNWDAAFTSWLIRSSEYARGSQQRLGSNGRGMSTEQIMGLADELERKGL